MNFYFIRLSLVLLVFIGQCLFAFECKTILNDLPSDYSFVGKVNQTQPVLYTSVKYQELSSNRPKYNLYLRSNLKLLESYSEHLNGQDIMDILMISTPFEKLNTNPDKVEHIIFHSPNTSPLNQTQVTFSERFRSKMHPILVKKVEEALQEKFNSQELSASEVFAQARVTYDLTNLSYPQKHGPDQVVQLPKGKSALVGRVFMNKDMPADIRMLFYQKWLDRLKHNGTKNFIAEITDRQHIRLWKLLFGLEVISEVDGRTYGFEKIYIMSVDVAIAEKKLNELINRSLKK